LDSVSALSIFVRAADARNFTDAGRQLSLSSSAVGKTIARLEDRLGVRLFNRSTRSITLTHEGNLFLESCRRILAEIESVETEFAQTKGAPKGKLRASLPLVGMLMMPTISKFIQAYPDISLDLDFTDHLVDVIDGGYDVVVRTGQPADSRLISRTLGNYRMQVVASPAYLSEAGRPSGPADLASHRCLHHRYPNSGKLQRWPFKPTDAPDIGLPVTSASSTTEPLIALAERGVGIACVPDFAIRRQIDDGTLVILLDEFIEHTGTFHIAWPSNRQLSPRLRAFVDFMAEHLFADHRRRERPLLVKSG
jgi:DNA-binding transcriptional LysR family regulator